MNTDFDIAGVTLASAKEWLRGERFASKAADLDTSRCEVAFLNEIGNLASYRPACLAMIELWDRGARCGIAHVVSDVFLRKYLKGGGIVTMREQIVWRGVTVPAVRLFIPADSLKWWVEKMKGENDNRKRTC